jgi:hypothetical protein
MRLRQLSRNNERRKTAMSDNKVVQLSEEQLTRLLTAAVKAAQTPNVLEQKEIEKAIEADKRRTLMAVEMGKAEEEHMRRRKEGCSHSRYPMSMGKLGGNPCQRGTGEWTTGGQLCGRNPQTGAPRALLICQRCAWTWQWEPNVQELDHIQETGLLGFAPPAKERLIAEG